MPELGLSRITVLLPFQWKCLTFFTDLDVNTAIPDRATSVSSTVHDNWKAGCTCTPFLTEFRFPWSLLKYDNSFVTVHSRIGLLPTVSKLGPLWYSVVMRNRKEDFGRRQFKSVPLNAFFETASDVNFERSTITLVNGDQLAVGGDITLVLVESRVHDCNLSGYGVVLVLVALCLFFALLAGAIVWINTIACILSSNFAVALSWDLTSPVPPGVDIARVYDS
ncbi:hypothetical protein K435DRAFT_794855 [Dendrothele bispora CBS 962.96]|uniref:Uncharacterized protein n=1 Tax=Dendrothele bispora (strain CBS 962.96) TaxID=1314807 RepID=A0A4S8MC00_DENBC|nr:hypothetical protein K435DRAFT_794855 [Dendrothele bispora CBS 962.96]